MWQNYIDFIQHNLLPHVFNFFKEPSVAISIALMMFACLILGTFFFAAFRWHPLYKSFKKVNKILNPQEEYLSSFKEEFPLFDEHMNSQPLLRHSWCEFKETMLFPNADSQTVPLKNTSRPNNYFHIENFESALHLHFYKSVPNYFVGFGLLFTFLGLVSAIYFASLGVSGDIEQAKEALGHLLTAATFKFMTSISGLTGSLLFSIIRDYLAGLLRNEINYFCEALEKRMLFTTPEGLAASQLEQLTRQTEQLERFNTDFAIEIAKALDQRLTPALASSVGSAMQPIVQALDGMSRNMGHMNQDALSSMVGSFQNSVQNAAGQEMRALADTLSNLTGSLQATVDKMGNTGGHFGSTMEQAASSLEQIMAEAARTMQASSAEATSKMEIMFQRITEHLTGSTQQASQEFNDTLLSTLKEMQIVFNQAGGALQQQFASSGDNFKDAIGKASGQLNQTVTQATQQMLATLMPFHHQMKSVEDTLTILDGRFKGQIHGFEHILNKLNETMTKLDGSSLQLSQAGQPISTTANLFGRIANQIEAVSQTISQSQSALTATARNLHEGAQHVQQTWQSYKDRFEHVDEDLTSTFGKLQEGTEAYNRRIIEYVKKVDDHFTESLRSLGGGIEQLKDSVEELTDVAAKMTKNYSTP